MLAGYPAWHKLYGKPKPKPKYLSGSTSNSVSKGNLSTAQSSIPATTPDEVFKTSCGIYEDQYQHLRKMIQSNMKSGEMQSGVPRVVNTIHFARTFQHVIFNIQSEQCHDYTNQWIIDSGATDHIMSTPSLLHNIRPSRSYLQLLNGQCAAVTHIGDVHISSELVLS